MKKSHGIVLTEIKNEIEKEGYQFANVLVRERGFCVPGRNAEVQT